MLENEVPGACIQLAGEYKVSRLKQQVVAAE